MANEPSKPDPKSAPSKSVPPQPDVHELLRKAKLNLDSALASLAGTSPADFERLKSGVKNALAPADTNININNPAPTPPPEPRDPPDGGGGGGSGCGHTEE